MAIQTAASIRTRIRALLNDPGGINYGDTVIDPHLLTAYLELQDEFTINNCSINLVATDTITVTALATRVTHPLDASVALHYNAALVFPFELHEKGVGEADENYAMMQKVRQLPDVKQDTALNWWNWIQQELVFLGSTAARVVRYRYFGDLDDVITGGANQIFPINAINFLSYRTAALLSMLVMENETRASALAEAAKSSLDRLISIAVSASQSSPIKQRPFDPFRRYRTWPIR